MGRAIYYRGYDPYVDCGYGFRGGFGNHEYVHLLRKRLIWLDELNAYIEGNIDYFVDYIHKHIPALHVRKPEGTYLVWVDCRDLKMNEGALVRLEEGIALITEV